MRISLLFLFFLCSCATEEVVIRKIASQKTVRPGLVEPAKSLIQLFPAIAESDGIRYYFYLQLKNKSDTFVDCDLSDLYLKNSNGDNIPFRYERVLEGRYYLIVDKTAEIMSGQMDVFLKGKSIKKQFQFDFKQASRDHSKISLVKAGQHQIKFRLQLGDKKNQPVEIPAEPEIIIDGQGVIEDLKHVKEGIWEFTLVYPEQNQIMYFSVRAHDVYLEKLFRYQHVEK